MHDSNVGRICALILVGIVISSCSSHSDTPPVTATTAASVQAGANGQLALPAPVAAGIALPSGYKIDTGRTLVFGTDENWTGRLSYSTSASADDVFDFLHREMPNFGWTETTAMRSDVSLLSFMSAGNTRVATIHIERGSAFGGNARVDMVVSPAPVMPTSQPSRGTMRSQSASQAR
jgi:hypothetical protein